MTKQFCCAALISIAAIALPSAALAAGNQKVSVQTVFEIGNNPVVINQSATNLNIANVIEFGGTGTVNATVTQSGTTNVTRVLQIGGTTNAAVLQAGTNNTAWVTQIGTNTNALIAQWGVTNTASVRQHGLANWAALFQFGR